MLHLFRKWSEVQILSRRMWCWRTIRCRRSRLPVWKTERARQVEAVLPVLAQCFAVSSRAAWRASDSADAACDCGGGGADHLPWTGGKETAATDAELARRFPAVEPGEYTRVCHLIEKHIYGEILLSPYEERTLNHFLEKADGAGTGLQLENAAEAALCVSAPCEYEEKEEKAQRFPSKNKG